MKCWKNYHKDGMQQGQNGIVNKCKKIRARKSTDHLPKTEVAERLQWRTGHVMQRHKKPPPTINELTRDD